MGSYTFTPHTLTPPPLSGKTTHSSTASSSRPKVHARSPATKKTMDSAALARRAVEVAKLWDGLDGLLSNALDAACALSIKLRRTQNTATEAVRTTIALERATNVDVVHAESKPVNVLDDDDDVARQEFQKSVECLPRDAVAFAALVTEAADVLKAYGEFPRTHPVDKRPADNGNDEAEGGEEEEGARPAKKKARADA